MIVGVAKEIKEEEYRVGITPGGVKEIVSHGHRILIEASAGEGSNIDDLEFKGAGAEIVSRKVLFDDAEMIIKVKEPSECELELLHEGQILFTFLHLASDVTLTKRLLEKRVSAIAYETVELDDGTLPILAPMSAIAGRLAVQVGAFYLQKNNGGTGILMGGVPGVLPAGVVILGCGTAGFNALQVAVGMGASVTVIEKNQRRLVYVDELYGGRVKTLAYNIANVDSTVERADVLIGAVLLPGSRAPIVVDRNMVRKMKPGSVIVDISVDQGGCVETTKPTTHRAPIFIQNGVVHYCVTNIPGIVPKTSTYALSNASLPYVLAIADKELSSWLGSVNSLSKGVNIYDGHLTSLAVSQSLGLPYTPLSELMAA